MSARACCIIGLAVLLAAVAAPQAWSDMAQVAGDESVSEIRQSMRDLRRANIKALPVSPDKYELSKSVSVVESMTVNSGPAKPQEPETQPTTPASPATSQPIKQAATQPASSQPAVRTKTLQKPAQKPAAEATGGLSLNELKNRPAGSVANPLALADALSQAGKPEEAAVFYALALEQPANDEEKAWLLFQLGDCLEKTDPSKAMVSYKRLLSECPTSSLCPAAEAKFKLADWLQKNDLKALTDQSK